jgi:hypothetical protein
MEFVDLCQDVLNEIFFRSDTTSLVLLSRTGKLFYRNTHLQAAIPASYSRLICACGSGGAGYFVDGKYVCYECSPDILTKTIIHREGERRKRITRFETIELVRKIYVITKSSYKLVYGKDCLFKPDFLYEDAGFENYSEGYILDDRIFDITISKEDNLGIYNAIYVKNFGNVESRFPFVRYLFCCYYNDPFTFLEELAIAIKNKTILPDLDYLFGEFENKALFWMLTEHPFKISINKETFHRGMYRDAIDVCPNNQDISNEFVRICESIDDEYAFHEFLENYIITNNLEDACLCGNPSHFKCDDCSIKWCFQCRSLIKDLQLCKIKNCNDCSNGICFNMLNLGDYCNECCSQELIDDYERKKSKWNVYENAAAQFDAKAPERRAQLIDALNNAGLKLSSNSTLYDGYIKSGQPSIPEIVRRIGSSSKI